MPRLYPRLYLLTILLVCTLFGCGGEAFDEPEPVEIGKLEQPLYMDFGYGADDAMNRCTQSPPWVGECAVPRDKGVFYEIPTTAFPNGCDSLFRGGIQTGVLQMASVVESNGGGWLFQRSDVPNSSTELMIFCTTGNFGTGGGETLVRGDYSIFGTDDCWNTASGEVCTFSSGTIYIHTTDIINSFAKWPLANAQQRTRLIRNIARHEVAHYLGLGHASPANSALMSQASFSSWDWFDNEKQPNAYELTRLKRYNPFGTTPL